MANRFGGSVLLDDTQALGILGQRAAQGQLPGATPSCVMSPRVMPPFGGGGGGSLRWHALAGTDSSSTVMLACSLAKAFGAPVASLSGSHETIRAFQAASRTRVHCSPPSVASIRAAEHALRVNRECGDTLRFKLGMLVRRFRARVSNMGLVTTGGLFPMQTLSPIDGVDASELHAELSRCGIETVLHQPGVAPGARISFLFNARHDYGDIDQATAAIGRAIEKLSIARTPPGPPRRGQLRMAERNWE
jgi:8-amino-7-oxononanoate synthase